jgi:hypothetical protein
METLLIIAAALLYLFIGRVVAQIYVQWHFDPYGHRTDMVLWTFTWPLVLVWWAFDVFVNWIDNKFF